MNLPSFVNSRFNFYAELFAEKDKIYIEDILDEDVKNGDLQSAVEFRWFMLHIDIVYNFLEEVRCDKDNSEKTIECFKKAYKNSKMYNIHGRLLRWYILLFSHFSPNRDVLLGTGKYVDQNEEYLNKNLPKLLLLIKDMEELLKRKYLRDATLRTNSDFVAPKENYKLNCIIDILELKGNKKKKEKVWLSKVPIKGEVAVYVDGSELQEIKRSGAGIYCPELNIEKSYEIPPNCYSHQAEVFAVLKAAQLLLPELEKIHRKFEMVSIYTDCKQVLERFEDHFCYSLLRSESRKSLQDLSEKCDSLGAKLRLAFVPAHVDIEGNERADKLAKGLCANVNIEKYPNVWIPSSIKICNLIFGKKCRFCGNEISVNFISTNQQNEVKNYEDIFKESDSKTQTGPETEKIKFDIFKHYFQCSALTDIHVESKITLDHFTRMYENKCDIKDIEIIYEFFDLINKWCNHLKII